MSFISTRQTAGNNGYSAAPCKYLGIRPAEGAFHPARARRVRHWKRSSALPRLRRTPEAIHDAKSGASGAKVLAGYTVRKGKPLATPAK
jgi:hypothetical protein